MGEGKYGLSETLRFLERQMDEWVGPGVELALELERETARAGDTVEVRLVLRVPQGTPRRLEYIVLAMHGYVQRDDQWRAYTEHAEVAQELELGAGTELILPAHVLLPADAVLTEDEARWFFEARAAVDDAFDGHIERDVVVIAPHAEVAGEA